MNDIEKAAFCNDKYLIISYLSLTIAIDQPYNAQFANRGQRMNLNFTLFTTAMHCLLNIFVDYFLIIN